MSFIFEPCKDCIYLDEIQVFRLPNRKIYVCKDTYFLSNEGYEGREDTDPVLSTDLKTVELYLTTGKSLPFWWFTADVLYKEYLNSKQRFKKSVNIAIKYK